MGEASWKAADERILMQLQPDCRRFHIILAKMGSYKTTDVMTKCCQRMSANVSEDHLLPDQLLVGAISAPPDATGGDKCSNAHAESPVQAQNALVLRECIPPQSQA